MTETITAVSRFVVTTNFDISASSGLRKYCQNIRKSKNGKVYKW
jgi:hypothetical protein